MQSRFILLPSLVIFILVLRHSIRRNRNLSEKAEKDFWARESEANSVRKKSLDNLEYISIPMGNLPMDVRTDDETIESVVGEITDLSSAKIVNFTGYTNTDLKLEYGAPNLTVLTEYDNNYTLLVQLLQKWTERLMSLGEEESAAKVCEFGMSINADAGSLYRTLLKYYLKTGNDEGVAKIYDTVSSLQSAGKNAMLRSLDEIKDSVNQ